MLCKNFSFSIETYKNNSNMIFQRAMILIKNKNQTHKYLSSHIIELLQKYWKYVIPKIKPQFLDDPNVSDKHGLRPLIAYAFLIDLTRQGFYNIMLLFYRVEAFTAWRKKKQMRDHIERWGHLHTKRKNFSWLWKGEMWRAQEGNPLL